MSCSAIRPAATTPVASMHLCLGRRPPGLGRHLAQQVRQHPSARPWAPVVVPVQATHGWVGTLLSYAWSTSSAWCVELGIGPGSVAFRRCVCDACAVVVCGGVVVAPDLQVRRHGGDAPQRAGAAVPPRHTAPARAHTPHSRAPRSCRQRTPPRTPAALQPAGRTRGQRQAPTIQRRRVRPLRCRSDGAGHAAQRHNAGSASGTRSPRQWDEHGQLAERAAADARDAATSQPCTCR